MFTIKKTAIAASVAIALGATALPVTSMAASAPMPADTAVSHDGIYGQVLGGLGYTPEIKGTDDSSASKITFKKPSWNAGVALGYKTGPMRFEGEFLYLDSRVKDITVDGTSLNALANSASNGSVKSDVNTIAGLANVYYDFDNIGAEYDLTPYVGVGIGIAHVKIDANASANNVSLDLGTSTNKLAYQGIAGVAYRVSDNTSLTLDYRYLGTGKINHLKDNLQNHSVNLGLVYRFDAPESLA